MNRAEVIEALAAVEEKTGDDEKNYLKDLRNALKTGKKVTNVDDYIDLLLGIAEENEDIDQQVIYGIVDYITEAFS